jgi:branched-chain amino acid transport system permease protein
MIIIGGMGSILGAYYGAAFIVVLPILLNQFPQWLGSRFRRPWPRTSNS